MMAWLLAWRHDEMSDGLRRRRGLEGRLLPGCRGCVILFYSMVCMHTAGARAERFSTIAAHLPGSRGWESESVEARILVCYEHPSWPWEATGSALLSKVCLRDPKAAGCLSGIY